MQAIADLIEQDGDGREVVFEYSADFPVLLEELRATLLVSTFQAGKVVVLAARHGKLEVSFYDCKHPMGLAATQSRLAIGCRENVEVCERSANSGGAVSADRKIAFCRARSLLTGNVLGHDLAWAGEDLWLVNTLYSGLCVLKDDVMDVRWKPPFITELKPEDRCHLNGLAVVEGRPRYVTALGQSNEPAGWRANKASGGCLIDVATNEVVLDGLCMPHSPRYWAGRLWMLNSGTGAFGYVDLRRGEFEPVELMPGYTRGLAFAGNYAFVALSKIRDKRTFDGLPIGNSSVPLHCGVGIVDLTTRRTVAVFQFHTAVTEIFAVEVISGVSDSGSVLPPDVSPDPDMMPG